MGGSSKQVTGYRYFANFLLFIGNPIEKVLGINFDKRGWQTPLIDEQKNPLTVGEVKLPNLYGENEGGVAGKIHARYGTKDPNPVDFYSGYLAKNDLPPIAYPYQSYLAFKDFYLGNSGYMKEMLLWVKRIHVRNDGREQWYDEKAEIGTRLIIDGAISAEDVDVLITGFYRHPGGVNNYDLKTKYLSEQGYFTNIKYELGGHATSSGEDLGIVLEHNLNINNTSKGHLVVLNVKQQHFGESATIQFGGTGLISAIKTNETGVEPIITTWELRVAPGDAHIRQVVSGQKPLEINPNNLTISSAIDVEFVDVLTAEYKNDFEHPDINPIHKIREILTDDTAMNKPESDVNDVNFIKAANRIWDEGLGISWAITEKSCMDAINELCGHIEAGVRVNRQTGLYEMVLFRDDWFDENEIHTLAANQIKSMSLEVANADEVINQLNVSYYNRDAIKDSSFSIAENASIRNLNGRVNAEDVDFPYFMNQRNAAVVAQWKLKQMSTPVWKGSFTTAEYNARKWNRYDLLKLAWPRKWQGEITVRIMKINLGTSTDVSIDFIEVTPYSSNLSSDIAIDEPIDVGVQPPIACQYEPFEMPYYLAVMALGQRQVDEELSYENNFGLVGVVAEKPQSNSLYAVMMTHDGTEGEEWLRAATINYEPTADLDQIMPRTSTSFAVKDSTNLASVSIGALIKCGSDWVGTPGEWMVFQGIDPYTGVVSVKRGALDSIPQAWGVNTKLYFCGSDVAYDQTEYVAGEEVLVSALTTTPSGMLENKGSIGVELNTRAIRPYPPANVKINGNYFPETLVISSDIFLTWAHRNRTQQTGGEILGWYEDDVTVENGVTYSYELICENVILDSHSNISANTVTIPSSVLKPNKPHTLKLWSVRDGYESYQKFEHSFFIESVSLLLTATALKDKVVGNTVPVANISVNIDESLKANMKFDGASISGKAQAGATITIEIED